MALATSQKTDFYVYLHKKKSDGTIFYVGKGFGNRCYRTNNRNKYWHNTANKYGFTVEFVKQNLDEELALLIEQEKIDQLKKLGYKLCNLTNGGEGVSGLKFSKESLKKLSDSHKSIKPSKKAIELLKKRNTGVPKTEEHKLKISLAQKGRKKTKEQIEKMINAISKPILCIETNETFLNCYEAEKKTGISRSGIGRVCRGQRKTAGKFTWRFI